MKKPKRAPATTTSRTRTSTRSRRSRPPATWRSTAGATVSSACASSRPAATSAWRCPATPPSTRRPTSRAARCGSDSTTAGAATAGTSWFRFVAARGARTSGCRRRAATSLSPEGSAASRLVQGLSLPWSLPLPRCDLPGRSFRKFAETKAPSSTPEERPASLAEAKWMPP